MKKILFTILKIIGILALALGGFLRGVIRMGVQNTPKVIIPKINEISQDQRYVICENKNSCDCVYYLHKEMRRVWYHNSRLDYLQGGMGRHPSELFWGIKNKTIKIRRVRNSIFGELTQGFDYSDQDLRNCTQKLPGLIEIHINHISYFGLNINSYNEASQYYFQKNSEDLSICEIDTLLNMHHQSITGNNISGYVFTQDYLKKMNERNKSCTYEILPEKEPETINIEINNKEVQFETVDLQAY